MAEVRLSAQFRTDLRQVIGRLAEVAGTTVADDFAVAFERSVVQLATHPGIGAPRGKLGRNVRILIVSPCLIFYEGAPKAKSVTVLRLLHGSRRITRRAIASGRDDE